ncbi:hypothetical protein [Spirosoma oryzae]|uniref:hypothetical protein n=1 Tax=Spirosoma oryzae TaxID=1469603 RepID=UPI00147385CD|nr:hypothetical protein [Spirosoma oryzae]
MATTAWPPAQVYGWRTSLGYKAAVGESGPGPVRRIGPRYTKQKSPAIVRQRGW